MSLKKPPQFLFTIDVDWIPGSQLGLEGLFRLCDQYGLPVTYFITGMFAKTYPDYIQEMVRRGDALGTHGWEHGINPHEDYRTASYSQQREWIQKSTEIVENVSGVRPVAFRAPNLWVSETTIKVLEDEQYRYDSSVPARRFDFGYGMVNSPRYAFAPLFPYYPSSTHIGCLGSSNILEVPPSAYFIPINMSALRVFGLKAVTWAVHRVLKRSPVLVFYAHPAEFVEVELLTIPDNEPARYRQGLGRENFRILGRFIDYILKLGCRPIAISGCSA